MGPFSSTERLHAARLASVAVFYLVRTRTEYMDQVSWWSQYVMITWVFLGM